MKQKLTLTCIIYVLCMSANQVHALSYKDVIPTNSSSEKISSSKQSQAHLLQIYVHRYQEEINNLYQSYWWDSSTIMLETNKLLNKMSRILTQIQNNEIDSTSVDEIIQSIVEDLKKINTWMKQYLQDEKESFEEKITNIKSKYIVLWDKISSILDTMISDLSTALMKKWELNETEKEIVRNLVILRNENEKIKNFKNIAFKTEEEIQIYFKNIISKIRNALVAIKSLL